MKKNELVALIKECHTEILLEDAVKQSGDIGLLKVLANCIKQLDGQLFSARSAGSTENVKLINDARMNMFNVISSCGYELEYGTGKLKMKGALKGQEYTFMPKK